MEAAVVIVPTESLRTWASVRECLACLFQVGFKGCDNKVSNKEVSFHSNRYPLFSLSVPIAGLFLAIVLYEDPLVFRAVFLGQPYFCTCCFLTA